MPRRRKRANAGLRIGIGIARGNVFSGMMGSIRKKEFTSVGMPVNIASRLQGLAKGGDILICENTFRRIKSKIACEVLPPVAVKGLDEPIPVYRPVYRLDAAAA